MFAGAALASRATAAAPAPRPLAGTASPVAVAVNPHTGDQYAFWRAKSGSIYEAWYTGAWHGPENLHWQSPSAPAVAVTRTGSVYVFWRGKNKHIYEAAFEGRWSGPQDLTRRLGWGASGETASAPAVAISPGTFQQFLFWRGAGGSIYEAWNSGRWHGPTRMGWSAASAPTAAVTDSGHEYVAWQGENGHIYEASFVHGWNPARDLTKLHHWGHSGEPASSPALSVNPSSGEQYLFWRTETGSVYATWYTERWHAPVDMGWEGASAPSVAEDSAGAVYVLWQGPGAVIDEAWDGLTWSNDLTWSKPIERWKLSVGSGAYVEAVQTTAGLSERMTPMSDQQFAGAPPPGIPVINVDDRLRYQRLTGVGGAMTDSAAWLIYDELSETVRTELMNALFGPKGIHLALTLVPMGGSDFTATGQPYTYDDVPAGQSDPSLSSFSIAHDQAYILPVLRQILAINPQAELFAVPWTAPSWMKANDAPDDLDHRGTLLPSAYQPLAQYFVKFLEAYAAAGAPITGIAPDNEPDSGAPFPAMFFPEPNEAQWISQNLEPALAAARLHPKLYGYDSSWSTPAYAQALISGPAAGALAGMAWHCYGGIPTAMSTLHAQAPGLDELVAECAPNLSRYTVPEIVIGAMRNWASTVLLWNLALDPSGGPVEPPDYGCPGCSGIVTVSEGSHTASLNRSYYQLGQISAFLQAGATRIDSNDFVEDYYESSSSFGVTPGLDDLAFENPDGSRVLVAYNGATSTARFAVEWDGRSFTYSLAPGATATFRWYPPTR